MFCSNCGSNVADGSLNCPACGAPMIPAPQQAAPQGYAQQPYNPYPQASYGGDMVIDRYASVRNHHDYLFGLLAYASLLGLIIVAVSEPNIEKSEYLKFHLNQSLVLLLFTIPTAIPFLGWLWAIFVFVCEIIAIIYAAKGVAKSATFFGKIRIIK